MLLSVVYYYAVRVCGLLLSFLVLRFFFKWADCGRMTFVFIVGAEADTVSK